MNIKDYFKIFIDSINKCFSNEQKEKLEKTTHKLFMEQPIEIIQKQNFILPKIEENDIVIQQKERYNFSQRDDIQINWNNLGNMGVDSLKNIDLLKIQRMSPTSFSDNNKIKHNMTQNEIYSISKVEDGKTGIKNYIYIKEFENFNGEFDPNKFNIVSDLNVVFLENKNKLCLIDSNNVILLEKQYSSKPLNYTLEEDKDSFYSLAKKIIKYDFTTYNLYFLNDKEKDSFEKILSLRSKSNLDKLNNERKELKEFYNNFSNEQDFKR